MSTKTSIYRRPPAPPVTARPRARRLTVETAFFSAVAVILLAAVVAIDVGVVIKISEVW